MEFSLKEPNEKENKSCVLEIEKISKKKTYWILRIILHTGRKHQIRSILSYFGYPILGDKKYGSNVKIENKIYLFAYEINFNNLSSPLSYLNGKNINVEKFLVEDFYI